MLVYGRNVAEALLKSNYQIRKVYLQDNFSDKLINSLLETKKLPIIFKSKQQMHDLSNGVHQGIILDIQDYKYVELDSILKSDSNFIVILDHIEDPRNFGAIIRTCECAGVDYIIIPNKRTTLVTSTVMKTSSGALTNQKVALVSNLNNTISKLKELGYWIVGSDAEGTDYKSIDYTGKVALIIGSEGFGLKELVRKNCDFIASIPLKGKVNSLNASVAAGILIYEVVRNRK